MGGSRLAAGQEPAAAPFRVVLEYTTNVAACATDEQLRAAVVAELGRDPFDEQAPERVTVAIRSQGTRLSAEIGLPRSAREAGRARVLESSSGDCQELVRALTLALCLVIDPLHVERQPATDAGTGNSDAASNAPTAAENGSRREPYAPPASRASGQAAVRAYLGFDVLGSTGLAPGVGLGLGLELGARRGPFSLGVEGRFDFPREKLFETGSLHVSPRVVSLVPCWLPAPLVACVLLSGGELVASGSDYPVNHRGRAPIVSAGVRLGLEATLASHLGLRVFANAQALLDHAEFIANEHVAWQAGPVFADVGVSGFLLY